ncbi:FACT complex subunit [Polyrhizophydium stewartii]|uniref:FACT complex subunit POB3 n=1 Tax=Polyrhizophydium stewartii TaxID=2732419 RepID=A0ABR4MZ49_9FUNG|nr:FACT complex subunit [Polyrhizophydium stewartii]
MSDSRRRDFDNIFLGGTNGPQSVGLFKLSEAGIGWKNRTTNEITTVPAADIKKMHWVRVAREYQLRITRKDGSISMFDGFHRDDFDVLQSLLKQFYQVSLETRETSLRGYNWGQVDFESSTLSFSVGKRTAFEIPLTQVSNASIGGKNEVSVEFHPPPPADPANPRARVKEDALVEIRFFVPGGVTASQVDEDSAGRMLFKDKRDEAVEELEDIEEGREAGEISQQPVLDADGEALTAASLFCETIKQKAAMDVVHSESIVNFSELLCLTPRSRFGVEMHETFFRLRGKSHDYKVMYSAIKRMLLLPKPDDLHYFFVIGLDPPLRQGQTRYPFLVFQFGREEEIETDLKLGEDVIQEKYKGELRKSYDGPVYEVFSEVFRGLTGKKIVTPSPLYRSAGGHSGLKCSQKANEAILFPLDKAFLAIPKPPIFFSHAEIAAVTFSRVSSSGSSSTKTFEVKFSVTSGVEYSFSSISREEHGPLEEFCQSKKLPIRNEIADEMVTYRDAGDEDEDEDDDDDDDGGKGGRDSSRRRGGGADSGDNDDDEDEESEDEDFVGESESEVDEEFNEDYESSDGEEGGQSESKKRRSRSRDDDDDDGGDDDNDAEERKKVTTKKPKTSASESASRGASSSKPPKAAAGKKAGKPAKDKNAPKRPLSAFLHFSSEKRGEVISKNPGIAFTEITKELGLMWKQLDAGEREKYERMALESKQRYERDMAEYKASGKGAGSASKPAGGKSSLASAAASKGGDGKHKSHEYVESDDDEDFD